MSFQEDWIGEFRHQASYTHYPNDARTPPPKSGFDSAFTLILRITQRTASQAAGDSPLSPRRRPKPHGHGNAEASEHSGQRALISCCGGFRWSRHDVTCLIYWFWGADRREEGLLPEDPRYSHKNDGWQSSRKPPKKQSQITEPTAGLSFWSVWGLIDPWSRVSACILQV